VKHGVLNVVKHRFKKFQRLNFPKSLLKSIFSWKQVFHLCIFGSYWYGESKHV